MNTNNTNKAPSSSFSGCFPNRRKSKASSYLSNSKAKSDRSVSQNSKPPIAVSGWFKSLAAGKRQSKPFLRFNSKVSDIRFKAPASSTKSSTSSTAPGVVSPSLDSRPPSSSPESDMPDISPGFQERRLGAREATDASSSILAFSSPSTPLYPSGSHSVSKMYPPLVQWASGLRSMPEISPPQRENRVAKMHMQVFLALSDIPQYSVQPQRSSGELRAFLREKIALKCEYLRMGGDLEDLEKDNLDHCDCIDAEVCLIEIKTRIIALNTRLNTAFGAGSKLKIQGSGNNDLRPKGMNSLHLSVQYELEKLAPEAIELIDPKSIVSSRPRSTPPLSPSRRSNFDYTNDTIGQIPSYIVEQNRQLSPRNQPNRLDIPSESPLRNQPFLFEGNAVHNPDTEETQYHPFQIVSPSLHTKGKNGIRHHKAISAHSSP